MNFTREPIIETILSPKDGYKLCVKSSKIADAEELFVDVVEIVSFGSACFFRGQERPKPFLVPISDYEVFEVKEARVALKNVAHDRNIKIGGGREAFPKAVKEAVKLEEEGSPAVDGVEVSAEAPKGDRKRDRRRNRRKRLSEEKKEKVETEEVKEEENVEAVTEEPKISSAMFTHLLPPPPTLISEKLSKLKEKERAEEMEEAVISAVEESTKEDSFF